MKSGTERDEILVQQIVHRYGHNVLSYDNLTGGIDLLAVQVYQHG